MQPKPRGSEVRQTLRRHTHDSHVRLDHHPLLSGITRPNYPLEAYRSVLAAYYHFYRAVEPAIEALIDSLQLDFDYRARRKLPWLLADLQYLEVDPCARHLSPDKNPGPFDFSDAGQLVGALYTIEGATLGGQVISRHLASNLGLTPERGARFFNGYGQDTADRWQQFESFMDCTCRLPEQCDEAGISAQGIFTLVEQLLDDYHAKFLARN